MSKKDAGENVINTILEKTTLGDIEELAALKEKMEDAAKKTKKTKAKKQTAAEPETPPATDEAANVEQPEAATTSPDQPEAATE